MGTRFINGEYSGKHTGTIGLLGCLSFNGNKIITTGGIQGEISQLILNVGEAQAEKEFIRGMIIP